MHWVAGLYANSGIYKNKGTFLRKFVLNSDFKKIATAGRSRKVLSTWFDKVDAQSVVNYKSPFVN